VTQRFQAGYNWCIRALQERPYSRAEIEANVDAQGINADDFDRGARAALRDIDMKEDQGGSDAK